MEPGLFLSPASSIAACSGRGFVSAFARDFFRVAIVTAHVSRANKQENLKCLFVCVFGFQTKKLISKQCSVPRFFIF